MKHLSGLWHKLTVVVAVAASLSSCNRAEYAMLPKTTSYHGTAYRAVTVAPAPEVVVANEAIPVAEAPVLAPVAAASVTSPKTATPAVAKAETPQTVAPAVAATPAKTGVAPKLNLAQKALVQKVVKKADKLASKVEFKQRTETASADDANALNRNIRNGIILLLVGLLVSLFSGISPIFGVLGGIISIIGIVLIILGLLDSI
jgi:hypothetical protein